MKNLKPLLHNKLKDISEIQPLSKDDYECLEEIKTVLIKHRKEKRFGVNLLHKHFNIDSDELLVESLDYHSRKLTSQPIRKIAIKPNNLIQTAWAFTCDEQFNKSCESFCPTDDNGNHHGHKDHY